jgi:hypothetical protein
MNDQEYRISLDLQWDLDDLHIFPHTYSQVYYFRYSVYPHDDENTIDRIKYAYSQYPWKGGYSAVNFYNRLKYTIPKKQRPQIVSIQMASPGWLLLTLIPAVAFAVARSVKSVCSSIKQVNATYSDIQKEIYERKLNRLDLAKQELDLDQKQLEFESQNQQFILDSSKQIAQLLGFESLQAMDDQTGSRYKTLKILLSYYRRIRTISHMQNNGKIFLPEE